MAIIPLHTRVAAIEAMQDDIRGQAFEFGSCLASVVVYFKKLGLDAVVEDLPAMVNKRAATKILGDQLFSAAVSARLTPIAPAFAHLGDLMGFEPHAAPIALDIALGICAGSDAIVWGCEGLSRVPVRFATHAWRLPEV